MNVTSAGSQPFSVSIAPTLKPSGTTSVTQSVSTPATSVTLGQTVEAEVPATYSAKGTLATVGTRHLLAQDRIDKLSFALLGNLQSSSTSARFYGVGAALLEQLSTNGGQSFSQSALAVADGVQPGSEAFRLQQADLLRDPANALSLTLTSASGATITLSLASDERGLAVSASVQGGQLSDQELKGLGTLAEGFQSAIDGLTRQPPALQLGALLKLDPALFTGLQMKANLAVDGQPQTFDLRLDDSTRSLALEGASGKVQLQLDNRDGALLGNAAQRKAAVGNYLAQFDAAQSRGQGDKQLMSLFKDAFTQLNSVDDGYKVPKAGAATRERALLSGLADFSASISQTKQSINPLRPEEQDTFDYSVSQSTSMKDRSNGGRSVRQDQQSSLEAAWHEGPNPQVELLLGRDYTSQNYRYHQVSDKASSTTQLAFDKNRLVQASATQQASQRERVLTYTKGDVTDDQTTSRADSQARNLLGMLDDVFERERISLRERGVSILEAQLASQRDRWELKADPSQIRP